MIFKKFHFKKITSTNDRAIKLIRNGYINGVITTELQSKGRGRQGKKWISKKGNLFMTIFFEIRKKISINRVSKKNLKLIKKVIQKFSKKKTNIKLPNDLMINKKKICGILQEIIFNKNRKFLIIGIGINIVNSPKIDYYPTCALNDFTTKKINKFIVSKYIKNIYEKNSRFI